MTPTLANEQELYFERGGPSYRLMQRIGLIRGEDPSVRRRTIAFLAITWVPLLILSALEGHALGPTPRESFLLDFAAYARFFVAVPLLLVAELIVGPRLTTAGLHFIRAGLVRPPDYPAFERAVARVVRWREALWPEILILGIAFIGAWTLSTEDLLGGGRAGWHTIVGADLRFSLAGVWNRFVAIPIIQFLFYRWLWRLIIWFRFLATVSRLDLDLVPTHADEAGGLGFLGTTHTSLGIFAFAISCVLSADAAFRIVFEGATIETFKIPLVVLLVLVETLFVGPLFLFSPILARLRREGLRVYSLLVIRYNRAFHKKWVEGQAPADEPFLGSGDIQSLADLGNSFQFIHSMRIFPFGRRLVLQLAVAAALPGLPLIALVVPIETILDTIVGAVY